MKKYIFFAMAAIAVFAAAYTSQNVNNNMNLSETQLANIEALTGTENSVGEVVKCYCKTNWFTANVCSANASGTYCGGDPCSDHDGNCR